MHSDTAASPAGRDAPDLDSDDHSDDDQEAGGRAGKRRRLVSVSCEICKQRKVKCDRGQPACGWCARNGAVCEYKERKRPGLRAGFGKELQERMDKLEAILTSHSELLERALPNQPGTRVGGNFRSRNASLPSDQGTPREPSHMYRPAEPATAPQVDAALSVSRPSTFTPTSQSTDGAASSAPAIHDSLRSQRPCPGVSSPLQLPPIQTARTGLDAYGAAQTGEPSSIGALPLATWSPPGDQDLPPYDLLYTLVDLYFKHINTWCPILHRRATLELLSGPSALQEADRILLHAIVATTMRYCTDPRLTRERRQHYHRVAKDRVLLYGMENSSVKSLQALVILALDLCGSRNGPPGWNIMALITRAVVQLGLAVESNSFSVAPRFKSIYTLRAMILAEPRDFIEEESHRRLFWMVYLLDRYATIATAFDFALSDKEVDRKLPCREELWFQNQKVETAWFTNGTLEHRASNPENLGAFAHYIEVLGILSKIHVFLKQPVDIGAISDVERWKRQYKKLDSMLASWMAGLPGEFGDMTRLFRPGASKAINCSLVMMHATFHTAVIRLHSSAAYPTTRSSVFTPSAGAAHLCLRAVEKVSTLAEVVVNNGMLSKLGPPFAFTIWVCARLLLVHGSTIENAVSTRISFFVDTLREIGRYWPVAARYCGLLESVLDEHAESQRQGGKVTPSSVKILSDMRRTAFDLDLLISRQWRQGPPSHALTPSKTPDQTELEYLDVFDFFNVPRLALGADGAAMTHEATLDGQSGGAGQPAGPLSEINMTSLMADASSDWLFQQDHARFE